MAETLKKRFYLNFNESQFALELSYTENVGVSILTKVY